jgi:hypothetical protein
MDRNTQPYPSWIWNEESKAWYPPFQREIVEGEDPNQCWIWNEDLLKFEKFPVTGSSL